MSSKRAKAKKRKAAELARRKTTVAKEAMASKDKNIMTEEALEKKASTAQESEGVVPVTDTSEAEMPVIMERKDLGGNAAGKESVTGSKNRSNFFGTLSEKLKQGSLGLHISVTVGIALVIAVIILSVRLGNVTKELEAIQAVSADYQTELADVKKELGEAELELFSKEPEKIYIEVYPTATPEPTPIPTATPEKTKYLVCVDAGHGDWDGGACIEGENYQALRAEKDDNLWMAKLFRDALLEYEDVEVVMTRETDVFLELTERTEIANEAEADALISFHRNSYDGEDDVNGVEFWIHSSRPKDAQSLASDLLSALMKVGGMENRGVKYGSMSSFREDYAINRRASMTSMIVELGFITSEKDNLAYDTNGEAYAKEMAKATYEWLVEQRTQDN